MKKTTIKLPSSLGLPKNNKKYVPTPEEANIIINYFFHNNFQDFNTWQQISKSKCQFQFNQNKSECVQCKVTLKWDDSSMPTIVQVSKSKQKKNAKKKALFKLVQNLIFLGLIGFGFKQADYIKKLPKRRKQSSDDESNIQVYYSDEVMDEHILNKNYQNALESLTYKNFQKFMSSAIKQRNFQLFAKILRKLQNVNPNQKYIEVGYKDQDIEDQYWQNYQESQLRHPFEHDLADILRLYQQFQFPPQGKQLKFKKISSEKQIDLPIQKLKYCSGNNLLQFFHPIEFTIINHRNNHQTQSHQKKSGQRSSYFSDYYKDIQIPIFETQESIVPISYKIIQRILNIILEFSYDYRLIIILLSIFQRQVTTCNLQACNQQQNQQFYLRHMVLITSEFAYLLNKKMQMISMSIQGLVNIEANGVINFVSKQPQQITAQKISRKLNTSQIQQMQQFANEQSVLLVSKIDNKIIQCWPSLKIRSVSLQYQSQKQKLPFTIYKLANLKLFNRLLKSIVHLSKTKFENLRKNSFVFIQNPTQPLITIIFQLVSQWIAVNQTILIVSQNFSEICTKLIEKGFKAVKITQKLQQKNIAKKQIICCSPAAVCADVIKNYAFTRVLIQGAQRISQTIATLALNKGYKKLYLIGDPKLCSSPILSKFAKNRNMNRSILQSLLKSDTQSFVVKQKIDQQLFDYSILRILNEYFYSQDLDKNCRFQSPTIKGFPWPTDSQRIVFIQTKKLQKNKGHLIEKVRICCQIMANVIKSGFITINQIACRVLSTNARALLTAYIYSMLKKYPELGVNPELGTKCVEFVTGSRFKQKSLCIMVAEPSQFTIDNLISALQEGRRGIIIISDFRHLKNEEGWSQILRYAQSKKLILQHLSD